MYKNETTTKTKAGHHKDYEETKVHGSDSSHNPDSSDSESTDKTDKHEHDKEKI